jgi:DNA-binding beta-propeller fold protein YncE
MNAKTILVTLVALGLVAAPASAKLPEAPVLALAADGKSVWASLAGYEVVRIDPATNTVATRTATGPAYMRDLAVGEGAVWGVGQCGLINCRYGVLIRFDPATGARVRPLTRLGANPRAVAVGAGKVWVLGARQLLRIDPRTGRLAATGPRAVWVGRNAQDVAFGGGRVWVTTARRRGQSGPIVGPCRLVSVDARSGRIVARRRVPCVPRALAFGFGGAWTSGDRGVPHATSGLATGFGRVWGVRVPNAQPGEYGEMRGTTSVTALDPDNGASRRSDLAPSLVGLPRIATGAGAVWVANSPPGAVSRIDPATGAVVATIDPAEG